MGQAAGRAWLEYLASHTDGLAARLREKMDAIEAQFVREVAAGQVKRGGRRFALVAAAGEMATEAGLTGWPAGEATRAARACYEAWVGSRGGDGSSEVSSMLRQGRRFFELHGEARFTWWGRSHDPKSPKTMNRAGFKCLLDSKGLPIKMRRSGDMSSDEEEYEVRMELEECKSEFFVLPEVFKNEICQGFDPQAMARVLLENGCLIVKEPGRFTTKERLPGGIGPTWCYRISSRIFELDI